MDVSPQELRLYLCRVNIENEGEKLWHFTSEAYAGEIIIDLKKLPGRSHTNIMSCGRSPALARSKSACPRLAIRMHINFIPGIAQSWFRPRLRALAWQSCTGVHTVL